LKKCFVTLCRSKGKNFWLITRHQPKRSKCLSVQHANIDIDKLLSLWDTCGLEVAVSSFQNAIMNGVDIILPEELVGSLISQYVTTPKKLSKKVQHKSTKQLDKIIIPDKSDIELQSILDSLPLLDDVNLDEIDNSNTITFEL
jgi:hypothetical protein